MNSLRYAVLKHLVKIFEHFLPMVFRRGVTKFRRKSPSFVFVCIVCVLCLVFYWNVARMISRVRPHHVENTHHSLCVIVPFRDRYDEMYQFIPHITEFLDKQSIIYSIFVINQMDSYRFNRGALINVGFKYSTNVSSCDYVALHDVDLLPLNNNLSYAYPGNEVFHITSPNLHPLYHYPTFLGGVILMNNRQFRAVNGLSNRYWGWGREDDEFYVRLKYAKIKIRIPENISTNFTNTFRHVHGPDRKRDYKRCFDQKVKTSRRDRVTGLNNVNYTIYSAQAVDTVIQSVTFVNVQLICDHSTTPWCTCKETVLDDLFELLKLFTLSMELILNIFITWKSSLFYSKDIEKYYRRNLVVYSKIKKILRHFYILPLSPRDAITCFLILRKVPTFVWKYLLPYPKFIYEDTFSDASIRENEISIVLPEVVPVMAEYAEYSVQ